MMNKLTFGKGNAKLGKNVYTFSLPAGFSCPQADQCLSKADKITGKITDGKKTQFRCFSASSESVFPSVRKSRWHNFDLLKQNKTVSSMVMLINTSIPKNCKVVRIHVSGDFYSQTYLDSWIKVAKERRDIHFYFYTKCLQLWLNRLDIIGDGHQPGELNNFVPTASLGGKQDHLINDHWNLRTATVLFNRDSNLEIDHDDSHAMKYGDDFGLLLHGTQPEGSDASKAFQLLKKSGDNGYSKNKRISLTTLKE